MIHCFHGLFGSPHMWDQIIKIQDSVFHDLYGDFRAEKIVINKDDILIGYSLGGRIALRIAANHNFNLKKLILISSHPGLGLKEIDERRKWESQIISQLKNETKEAFLRTWNGQPIFSSSSIDDNISNEIYKKSLKLFQDNLLSQQPHYWNELVQNKEKVIYIHGTKDIKYSKIAEQLSDLGIRTIPFLADHRVYFNKNEMRDFFQKEILA